MGRLGIPSRLTIAVVPLAVLTLLSGLFLVWAVSSSDSALRGGPVIVIAVVLGLTALGTLVAVYVIGRSVTQGIDEVAAASRKVAHRDLIDLLDTLRDPEADLTAIAPPELDTEREDEVGDLARSFAALHSSLVEVAARQMEMLRRGVSGIFVTLARRNSSLIDRQLALLDELEAKEDDPRTLSGYYQLDHFATRMRRNAESLLVLAGSHSPRVWGKATDMSDVVRAAISEIDEFHRVEVVALDPARLSGGAVSDFSHLLAELIENAIQFSPPSEQVRVTGLFDSSGYQVTISDRGVGVSESRLAELNNILSKPPTLGLSVEPTLGMYVIARLAHRHGVTVELTRGVPGLTAKVTVPRDHLEVVEAPQKSFYEVSREERVPAGPDMAEITDSASRAYVLKHSSTPAQDEMIDLTSEEMTEPGELPTRTPGHAFSDPDDAASTGPGESAVGIRSALSAFQEGRRAAAESDET